MLYDNYKRKILSVGQVLKVIIKFLPLIITLIAAITVISATLVATKGIVSDIDLTQTTVEYGNGFNPHASAFLSDITYEYSADGINWTTDYPDEPGTYHVRAVGNASFGNKRYSNAVTFEIAKRKIEVSIPMGVDFIYGSRDVYAAVAEGDFVECGNFVFENIKEIDENTANADITPVLSTIRIFDSRGNDITKSHYDISVVTLDSNVVKLPLNITVQDQNEIYNGNTFSFDTYEFDNAELAVGDTLVSTYPTSIIEPGEQEITPTFQVRKTDSVNADNEPVSPIDITAFYKLNVTYGTLTVEKRPLVIELDKYTAEYTGVPIEYNKYTIVENEESFNLADGHHIEIIDGIVYPTDAGTYANPTVFMVVDDEGNDVTDKYYSLIQREAEIEITKRSVTIEPILDDKVYDGNKLTSDKIEVQAEDLVDNVGLLTSLGHKVDVVTHFQSSSENAGTYVWELSENALKITVGDVDVTANYDITCGKAEASITKRPVEISPVLEGKVYDGNPITSDKTVSQKEDLINHVGLLTSLGHKVEVVAPFESGVNVGEYTWAFASGSVKIKSGEDDVTANYQITYGEDTASITVRPVTVTPVLEGKVYDGEKLTSSKAEAQAEDIANYVGLLTSLGHEVEVVAPFESNADVGEYTWTLVSGSVKIKSGEDDVTANYAITYGEDTASITARPVTITPVLEDKVYDGEKLTSDKAEAQTEDLVNYVGLLTSLGHEVEVVVPFESSADVGEYTWTLVLGSVKIKAGEDDLTANYAITYGEATAQITKRPITVTTVSDSWIYDGQEHSNDGFECDGILKTNSAYVSLPEGENMTVSIKDVGSVENKFEIKVIDNTKRDVTFNYEITYVYGELEITERKVYIIPDISNREKLYDADYFYADAIKEYISGEANTGLLDGHGISLKNDDKHIRTEGSNAGEALLLNFYADGTVTSIEDILDFRGGALSSNYNVVYRNDLVTVTITKRPVEISPMLEGKVYDGNKLTSNKAQAQAEDLINHVGLLTSLGHKVEVVVPFESSADVGEYTWTLASGSVKIKSGEDDVTNNYAITYGEDTASITARPVTITPVLEDKVYDGKKLTSNEKAITSGTIVDGHTVSVTTYTSSSENVGTYTWTLVSGSVKIKSGEDDVTANYAITYGEDTASITARPVTITPVLEGKVYDGEKLTSNKTEAQAEDLINHVGLLTSLGHKVEVIVPFESSADVGEYTWTLRPDSVRIKSGEDDVTANYQITYGEKATAKITERTVYIIPVISNREKVYDADYFFADAIREYTSGEANTGLLTSLGHSISLKWGDKHIHTESKNAGENLLLNFNADGTATSIEDILDFNGGALSSNYNVVYRNDLVTVTITKRPVAISPVLNGKVYDGNKLTSNKAQAQAEDLINHVGLLTSLGHKVEVIVPFESSADVGEYTWTLASGSIQIKSGEDDVTNNYAITYGEVSVEITKYTITFTPKLSHGGTYDGNLLKIDILHNGSSTWELGDGNVFTVSMSFDKYVNAGTYSLSATNGTAKATLSYTKPDGTGFANFEKESDVVIKLGDSIVTDNFDISYGTTANQTINKRAITLTPQLTHGGIYDGNSLKIEILHNGSNTWELSNGNVFTSSMSFNKYVNAGTYSLSATNGTAKATLSYTKPDGTGFANFEKESDVVIKLGGSIVTDNFDISYDTTATQVIEKRSVFFKPLDSSVGYNGKLHAVSEIEEKRIHGVGLLSGHRFECSNLEFSYTYTDENGSERTSNSGFAGNPKENSVAIVKITSGTIRIYDGISDVTDNYVIDTSTYAGELTVLARILHVTPVVSDKVFDGEVITSSGMTFEWKNVDGSSYEIRIVNQAVSGGVNVTEEGYDIKFKAGDIEVWDNGENITDSCKIIFETAKASITPRPVYITTGSAEKEYDGTPLSCDQWTLDDSNDSKTKDLLGENYRDKISVTFDVTRTDVGESDNTATAYINENNNFSFRVSSGKLIVTPCKIKLTLANIKSVYDGNPITKGIKFKVECAIIGKIAVDITQINVINVYDTFNGVSDLVYTVRWKDTGNNLASENYELIVNDANICRTKANITLTSNSFTVNYDGKYHSDPTVTCEGLPQNYRIEGCIATAQVMGNPDMTITENNTISTDNLIIYNGHTIVDLENFNIHLNEGKITIIPKQS